MRLVRGMELAQAVGGVRRGEEFVDAAEVLAPLGDPALILDALGGFATETPDVSESGTVLLRYEGVRVAIHTRHPGIAGAALLDLTGTAAHLEQLGRLATSRDWDLRPHGLLDEQGFQIASETEEQLYAALGLGWIAPELREGGDEIVAALNGSLPQLVERSDIRGDLHMHTDFSDGRDTLEDMVASAAALGYEYVAITDHSPHSAARQNLSEESLARQAENVARVRERYPSMTILHGCEVDILPDGRLDFPDTVLETLDIVLASLHDRAGHSPDQLLERYFAAMRHPLVTLITHPTNRVLPYQPGYDVDYERVFEAAVETGTLLEIDGAPSHLDLPGPLARRAAAAGVMLTIDSDCHRADFLDRQMRLGLTMARRGWIEPQQVLNTRPVEDIKAAITLKRRR